MVSLLFSIFSLSIAFLLYLFYKYSIAQMSFSSLETDPF